MIYQASIDSYTKYKINPITVCIEVTCQFGNVPSYKMHMQIEYFNVLKYSGAGKLNNLGAGGAPSSQILQDLTKFYGPSTMFFLT